MKQILIFVLSVCSSFRVLSQETDSLESRHILFFYFTSKTTQSERVSKTLGRVSDSLIINKISIVFEKANENNDTLICKNLNGSIVYSPKENITDSAINIFLLVELKLKNKKSHFNEKLTIPFKDILLQTNDKSNISITLDRKRNNFYRVTISKLDFPFIVFSTYLNSEIIGFYK